MTKNKSAIKAFIDNISDEKLKNFVSSQKTLVKKNGFRLDHQGVNNDGSGKHRLYIQPLGKGKSEASKQSSANVLAQIHISDPGDPQKIREALVQSAKEGILIKLD